MLEVGQEIQPIFRDQNCYGRNLRGLEDLFASHHGSLAQMHSVPPLRRVIVGLAHLPRVGSVFVAILAWAAPNSALPETT